MYLAGFAGLDMVFVEDPDTLLGRWAARDWVVWKGGDVSWDGDFDLTKWPTGGYTSLGLGTYLTTAPIYGVDGYYYYYMGSGGTGGTAGPKPSMPGIVPADAEGLPLIVNSTPEVVDYYLDMYPSRNPVWQFVDAVEDGDLETSGDRSGLMYEGELYRAAYPGSLDLERIQQFQGKEIPARVVDGDTILDGWEVNLQDMVDDELSYVSPGTGVFTISKLTAREFRFISRVYDYGDEVTDSETTWPALWAIKAGVHPDSVPKWRKGIYGKYFGEERRFLTWRPGSSATLGLTADRVFKIKATDKMWLSYLVNMSPVPEEINLMVSIHDASYYHYQSTADFQPGDVVHVNMALQTLFDWYGAGVKYFDVFLYNENAERLTEVVRFILDRREVNTERYVDVRWANSAGGWDCMSFLRPSSTLGLTVNEGEKVLSSSYTGTDAELFVKDKMGRDVLNIITDTEEKATLEWLEELVWSEKVEVYDSAKDEWVAVNVADRSFSGPEHEEYVGRRAFTLAKAKKRTGYSALPAGEELEDRPTAWLPVDEYCITDAFGKYTGLKAYANLKLYYIDVTPNEAVRGYQKKANVAGVENYVGPVSSTDCEVADTPFTNDAVSRDSTKRRTNCGDGYQGGPWTISIDAGVYGGSTQAEADRKASEAITLMDTQANANLYGSCTAMSSGLLAEFWNFTPSGGVPPAGVTDDPAEESTTHGTINFNNNLGLSTVTEENFWGRWTGYIKARVTGNVEILMKYDHAVSMVFNGVEILNSQSPNGFQYIKANVNMVEGVYYPIEINFWELTGFYGVQLCWKVDDGTTPVIASEYLFRD